VLNSAGDEKVTQAEAHGRCRVNTRAHPRGTEPVDRFARYFPRQASQEESHPGHIPIVLTGLIGTAQHHVRDAGRIDGSVSIEECSYHRGGEVIGPHW
jgi:hypothetical protein